jgi:hypothetical protein
MDCLAMPVPDYLAAAAAVAPDCLVMPAPDSLAAAVSRLDGGSGDRALGQWRR